LNFIPQVKHQNAIRGNAAAAVPSTSGTTSGSLQPEQVVVRPANSGFRLNPLPHLVQEKEIIGLSWLRRLVAPEILAMICRRVAA
jgi:hypothetical protein